MRGSRLSALLLAVAGPLAGCAGDKQEPATTTVQKSSGDPLLDRYASSFRYEKSPDGSTRIVSDKRSEFEGAHAQGYGQQYGTKDFKTKEQARKPWWGSKEYTQAQAWDGVKSAHETGQTSPHGSRRPTEAGQVADGSSTTYDTGAYATGRAREHATQRLHRPADALTSNRRESYPEPYIIGWEKQRELSVEQTKGILGRGQ